MLSRSGTKYDCTTHKQTPSQHRLHSPIRQNNIDINLGLLSLLPDDPP